MDVTWATLRNAHFKAKATEVWRLQERVFRGGQRRGEAGSGGPGLPGPGPQPMLSPSERALLPWGSRAEGQAPLPAAFSVFLCTKR